MRLIYLPAFILLSSVVYAQDFYFCSQTSNYVYINDSLESVQQNCGKPISTETSEIQPTETREIERWTYNYHPNAALRNGQQKYGKDLFIVDFYENQAVKIMVQGQSVQSTNYCSPFTAIKLGDTGPVVYQVCRYPTTKETINVPVSDKSIQQTILTYPDTTTGQNVKLIFHDGQLAKIE